MKIEEKFVDTEHGRVFYLEAGKGQKTIVFIHGFLGQPVQDESWARKLAESGWRVILPYLPGHRKSFDVPQKYAFQELVTTMVEFVVRITQKGVVLAGHSLGGAVAWEIACKKPNLVTKLVLVDPGIDISHGTLFTRILKAVWNNLVFDIKAWKQTYPQVWNFKLLDLLPKTPVSDLMPNIPIMLLRGQNDKITSVVDYGNKLEGLKNLKVKVFRGGHHWYRWQADKYLKAVEEFI